MGDRIFSGLFALVLGFLVIPSTALATPITLSNASSNELLILAVDMQAAISFSVSGSELTVDVTNNAMGGAEPLSISEIYFNAGSAVTGLTLISAPTHSTLGTMLWSGVDGAGAQTFGVFDFSLKAERVGQGQSKETGSVDAGQVVSFLFAITGVGVTASDFGVHLSTVVAGETAAMGAALFKGAAVEAYGAQIVTVIPEPGTSLLLGLGLMGLARQRRGGL